MDFIIPQNTGHTEYIGFMLFQLFFIFGTAISDKLSDLQKYFGFQADQRLGIGKI